MDLRKLKTLIDLVAESDIAELEVTEGESKVRIVKSSAVGQGQMMMMPQQGVQQFAAPAPAMMFPVGQSGRETLPEEVAQASDESRVQFGWCRGGG